MDLVEADFELLDIIMIIGGFMSVIVLKDSLFTKQFDLFINYLKGSFFSAV